MKVLISGGLKTQNIVKGLEKKFISGGVDFIVVPFIEDIDSIYQRGEYFDRALIIEQCWNRDFEITDESVIRKKINEFARTASLRDNSAVSFVFLSQTKETAEMVYEEILAIQQESTVVIKAPRYTVSFFSTLVTSDIDKFPDDILYKPEVIQPINETNVFEEIKQEEKVVPDYKTKTIDNIEEDLLNNNVFDSTTFDDYDKGIDFEDLFDNATEDTLGNTTKEDGYTEDIEEVDDNFDNNFDDLDDNFGDMEVSVEIDDEYGQSGDIPDFSGGIPELYEGETEDEVSDDLSDNSYTGNEVENDVENLFSDDDYGTPDDDFNDGGYQDKHEDEYNDNPQYIDDDEYGEQSEYETSNKDKFKRPDMTDHQLRATLDAFASRGNSIVVTGSGGCGTSLTAYNLANTIVNLGYTCLLVDMDTEGRTQSYISKDNYDSIDYDSYGLMSAINSSSGINAHIAITRQGFHLLTLGLGSDVKPIEQMLNKEKLSRFANLAKTSHNFVIYDMPFKTATDFAKDLTFMADNIVLVIDSSNWGITKAMLSVCNIESDDMQDAMFSRAQLLFNRYRGLNKVLGRKVKSAVDITKAIDKQVLELIGEDTGYYFQNMHICGVINDDVAVEEGWFSNKPYSETPQGQVIFTELLCNIVLKR